MSFSSGIADKELEPKKNPIIKEIRLVSGDQLMRCLAVHVTNV